jgi:drug/metabolite transporter (DMT)-like permease
MPRRYGRMLPRRLLRRISSTRMQRLWAMRQPQKSRPRRGALFKSRCNFPFNRAYPSLHDYFSGQCRGILTPVRQEFAGALSDNVRGSIYMLAAMLGFAFNDIIVKSFAGSLAMEQLIFIRGLFACFFVMVLIHRYHGFGSILVTGDWRIYARAFADVCATYLFITAIFRIPLADATAILQFLPLAVTLGAAYFLHEQIGWRRMLAIAAGFLGVMVILKPGVAEFDGDAMLAVGAVFACAIRDLLTRLVPAQVPSLPVAMISLVAVTVSGGVLSVAKGWQPMSVGQIALLAVGSMFLLTGNFFAVTAMRVGEIGFVSPFRYAILLFAIVGGMIFYGEVPDTSTVLGSVVIVSTGIYALYRERVIRRQAINPPPAKT